MTQAKALFLKPPAGASGKNIVRDFLYGCWCNGRRIGGMQMPPLTELMAATHVRQEGLETIFLDAQFEPLRYEALMESGLEGFMAVAMMSSTQSFKADAEELRRIKSVSPYIKTILYGSHPTFMPEYCLKEEGVDFVVTKEPEESLRELLHELVKSGTGEAVTGTGSRAADGTIRINPDRPFSAMDDLAIPDRTLLPKNADYFNPVVKRVPYTSMLTSRGCPARCNYCTAPVFYGNKTRVRSAESVLEEMRQIKALGYREIFFRDETFSAYKGRNYQIFEGMERGGLEFTWIANGRVDMVDEDSMRAMKKAGCHLLKFGVETGSAEMLERYKKGATLEQAEFAFRKAREIGLDTHAHIIFGGPGETRETIQETRAFLKKLRPGTATFGILTPYPGTEIFDMVAEIYPDIRDGSGSTMDNLHTEGFYSDALCSMGGAQLSQEVVGAYRQFYLRPGYLLERLSQIRSLEELTMRVIGGYSVLQFAVTGKK
jgi:radical SAM superfamily enzyme YgiQ (UPF0313 family)